ncbi:MAG: N-acetylmuramoyl-L-alanine amidase [Heliobacteriaceae bacterium]|nr:N-acetylmuramoyl-L-alanine amidase [Heliobacteriaceae bacterium]
MPKVAIIPGHGGFDPGAVNPRNKVRECDGNLSVALKLSYLLRENGIEPVLSREEDIACSGATTVSRDVTNQTRFANNSEADIAIAIHFNGFTNPAAHGIEVLYTNYPAENPYEVSLAQGLLAELVTHTGMADRGIKEIPQGIGVLKYVKIPCVLSENGFVTNDQESIWCADEEHNWILAKAHAIAICNYFGLPYQDPWAQAGPPTTQPAPVQTFADVPPGHPYYAVLEESFRLGLVGGYENPDGTRRFEPDAQVSLTRAELAQLILTKYREAGKPPSG